MSALRVAACAVVAAAACTTDEQPPILLELHVHATEQVAVAIDATTLVGANPLTADALLTYELASVRERIDFRVKGSVADGDLQPQAFELLSNCADPDLTLATETQRVSFLGAGYLVPRMDITGTCEYTTGDRSTWPPL